MTFTVTSAGKKVAVFIDYNVAILCLPALARAVQAPVWLSVPDVQRSVPLPRGVRADTSTEAHRLEFPILVCEP